MAEKTTLNGRTGVFIEDAEMLQLQRNIKELNEKVATAEGQSKYKLKKLAQIIERKEKKIAQLTTKISKLEKG